MAPDPVLAAELYEPNTGLLTLAGVLLVGWYAVLVTLTLIRWPKTPSAGPPTNDLGPESPAIANLLTNGWLLNEDAMPATLLDLAARGLVKIEDRGDGRMQCRVPARSPGTTSLNPYEQRILDHIIKLASDGVVPVAALTTGPDELSKNWWNAFRKEVSDDAKERGVASELWPVKLSVLMFVLGVPIYLLIGSGTGFREHEDVRQTALLQIVTFAMWGGLFPLVLLTVTARLRDTPGGRTAAAHWFGVRKNLEGVPSFPDLPPNAVVTWERHLAYGAALGVAGRTVKELPLGAEHDRRAWTDYGGAWHQVRVRYPVFRPGWGKHPLVAALISVAVMAGSLGVLWLVNEMDLLRSSSYGGNAPWWTALVPLVIVCILLVPLVWAATGLAWAAMDLTGTTKVEGEVLRTRARGGDREGRKKFYVAVYTGQSDTVLAWRVAPKMYSSFYQGQIVTLDVTPRLGYVRVPP
jgi:Predicted membrane protein (DUF2207)